MTADTQETSSHTAIETAVPLLGTQTPEDFESTPHRDQQDASDVISTKSSLNMKVFLVGTIWGGFVTCLSLGSLQWMYLRYGNEMSFPTRGDVLEQIYYSTLFCLSHSWDTFYPLTCAVFFCTLSSQTYTKRVAKAITGQENIDAEAVFIMIVFLEGGFLVGTSGMGMILELLLGIPLSFEAFAMFLIVDMIMCYLLVIGYEWTKEYVKQEEVEENDEQDAEFSFVAIV
jgi:hypothetical protein